MGKSLLRRSGWVLAVAIILILWGDSQGKDNREYQHGIDFVRLPNGDLILIWASSSNPPSGAVANGRWSHDVFYSFVDRSNFSIRPTTLIARPEAQEAVSAAISKDGYIMVTVEDGWNVKRNVAQRYAVYDAAFKVVKAYPQDVQDGGHSGHVAAVGERFVVFYSEGWIEGGGVDALGTGDNVAVAIYSSTGTFQMTKDIATGNANRDWWPLVAGSSERACLVWQRYVKDKSYAQLMYSVLDPTDGSLIRSAITLEDQVKYYTYSVEYIPAIERFLILGVNNSGNGFAYLLGKDGRVKAKHTSLPPIVRESQPVVRGGGGEAFVVQVTEPKGLMILRLTRSAITLGKRIADDYLWDYTGTDGVFTKEDAVYIVSLSAAGLVPKTFDKVLPNSRPSRTR